MHARPQISILLPAYNAQEYILQSVQSVLSQTYEDFELIIINDGSSDGTAEILNQIRDHRLRIIENPCNLGIVKSLNRGMDETRGKYVARMDADDIALPTRLAKQKGFLDRHPETLIVGTKMSVLEHGRVVRPKLAQPCPWFVRWLLHVSNPVGHPTMMFRAELVNELGAYLRHDFEYAEDFDFSHRVLRLGDIAIFPEHLVIYRKHDRNLTVTGQSKVVNATAAVLGRVYAALLGWDCEAEARLVAEHVFACAPIEHPDVLHRLGEFLNTVAAGFVAAHNLSGNFAERVLRDTGRLWWNLVQTSLRAGHLRVARHYSSHPYSSQSRPPLHRIARSLISGAILRRDLRYDRRQAKPANR